VVNAQLQALNAVLKNNDINTLYSQQGLEELFADYGDVISYIKDYNTTYDGLPSVESVVEKFRGFEDVEVPDHTQYYFDQARNDYISARIEQIMTAADAAKKKRAPQEVLQILQASLSTLNRFSGGVNDLDIMDTDVAEKHYAEVRERAEAMGGMPGIPTGIAFVDSAYPSGMAPGDLIVMLGWTGRGKSFLSTLFACNAHECGFVPMIVSLEMSGEKVRDRAYTIKGSGLFSNSQLSLGDFDLDNFSTFKAKQSGKQKFIVVTNEGAGELTPNIVEAKIDQHNPKLVVVDYAQLASDNANSDSMTHRMMNMSKEYKRLAVKKQVAIIIISSATAESASSSNEPPTIEQVAWSRQLAYDADLAFAVHRLDDSNLIMVVCRKNRNGPLFAGLLDWDLDRGIWEEKFD
jgi:replicative DNA helicase